MAEEKKIENAVYEYDALEERTERRPATVTPYEREICQHMEGLFPHRVTRVYREIDSEFLSVNVFVMKAPTKKDFHVLYTTGMSAMPMKLPQEFLPKYKDLERAELLLFLPAEWDILTGYETDADVPLVACAADEISGKISARIQNMAGLGAYAAEFSRLCAV